MTATCQHCRNRVANSSRGLCRSCNGNLEIRSRYAPLPRGLKAKRTYPACRHCKTGRASRPRSLCSTCYDNPAIREANPSTSKFGRRYDKDDRKQGGGWGDNETPTKVGKPTTALPGSELKLRELRRRVRYGFQLFHPHDARGNLS